MENMEELGSNKQVVQDDQTTAIKQIYVSPLYGGIHEPRGTGYELLTIKWLTSKQNLKHIEKSSGEANAGDFAFRLSWTTLYK